MKKGSKDVKGLIIYWGVIVLILFSLVLMIGTFSSQFQKAILDREIWQAEKVSYYISKIAKQEIERCEDVLLTTRLYFSLEDIADNNVLINKLDEIKNAENRMFVIGYMYDNNEILYNDGTKGIVSNQELIETINSKNNYVSNHISTSDIESNTLQVAVPVTCGDEVIGALIGYYHIEGISDVLGYDEESLRYFQIIDKDGNYVSKNISNYSFATGTNMWNELSRYSIENGVTVDNIKADIQAGKSGSFYFTFEGQGRYVSYEPLGINEWYIYSVLVEEGVSDYTKMIGTKFRTFVMNVSIMIILLVVIISLYDKRQRTTINKQNEELVVKNKLFNMIIEKAHAVPFEFKANEKSLSLLYSDHFGQHISKDLWKNITPENCLENKIISEESFDDFKELYDAIFMRREIPNDTVLKVQIRDEYKWIKVNVLRATENNVVGFFEDYDKEMRQQLMIEEVNKQVMIDDLTGLYRRESFVKLMTERNATVNKEKLGAFMLIDLDGFKEVNDKLGHALGDFALLDAAISLKSVLRKDDIVGRLGGDEFVVYLEGIKDLDGVARCAMKVNEVLVKNYEKDNKEVKITASMGIVVYDKDTPFKELYERADEELYKVKLSSKNNYRILQL